MPLFQGFCPVAGTICPSLAAAVVGPSRAPQGMKKGRRPRRRPRLKLSDKAGPDQCPVPGENALFPAQIAGFLAVSRAVPVYPVFLNYVVPVQFCFCRSEKCTKKRPRRVEFPRCGAAVLFFGFSGEISPCLRSQRARSSLCTCPRWQQRREPAVCGGRSPCPADPCRPRCTYGWPLQRPAGTRC